MCNCVWLRLRRGLKLNLFFTNCEFWIPTLKCFFFFCTLTHSFLWPTNIKKKKLLLTNREQKKKKEYLLGRKLLLQIRDKNFPKVQTNSSMLTIKTSHIHTTRLLKLLLPFLSLRPNPTNLIVFLLFIENFHFRPVCIFVCLIFLHTHLNQQNM